MKTHPPRPATPSLTLSPIGLIRTTMTERVEAPRQPAAAQGHTGTIELFPGQHYEDALADLAGFERIWVLFWFDRNEGWRPKVLPPRSTSGRKGVFATRSPHRPNPLGLSALRLTGIDGLRLDVADVDLLDGTPVLDIKPYIAYTDAWPDSASGWLDADALRGNAVGDPLPGWSVTFTPEALAQAAWIERRTGLPLAARIRATLVLGPQPHAYRRIRRMGEAWQLAVRDWRARFSVDGQHITVTEIRSGYRATALAREDGDPALAIHRDYVMATQGGQ